ncbi:MAG TPA: hypothetical protein VJT09_07815 [Pyrinomonadaceae bacterium]|nr:hypothetical protein [Pyrinomonadaceae bacterium]
MRESALPSKAVRLALAAVLAHAVVSALHAAAHQVLGINASPSQTLFIVAVILVAPLVAGFLLWKGKRAGAVILACAMAGSLIFGVYNHFWVSSPDHVTEVGHLPQKSWALVFQVSAALLALVEAFGIWAGMRVLGRA